MSYIDSIALECICRLRNGDRSTSYMTINSQEYKIAFECFENDNLNDFRFCKNRPIEKV